MSQVIPEAAVSAAVRARRDLKLDRYYKTREVVTTTHEGNRIFRSAPEPTEEEYARAALEAAAPHMSGNQVVQDDAVQAASRSFYGTTFDLMTGSALRFAMDQMRAALEAAAPYRLADVTSGRKLLRTYFRSLTPDGKLWCESRNRNEVLEMSEGKDCTFEAINFYETTDGWDEWTP